MKSIFLFLCFAFISNSVFAEEYTIQIHRPSKVGMRHWVELTVTSTRRTTQKVDGREPLSREVKWSAQFKGIVTVEKVNKLGNRTQMRIEVESFTRTQGGFTEELAKKGAVILGRHSDGKNIYESLDVDSKKKSPINQRGIVEALDRLFSLGKTTTKEAAYGTKKRQKITNSWKVDGKAMAAVLSNKNLTVDPSRVRGKITLVKALRVRDVPCLEFNAQIKITGIVLRGWPPSFFLLKANTAISDTLILPVDINLKGLGQAAEVKFIIEFEQDGKRTTQSEEIKATYKWRSLKDGK